jgi:tRNA-Thr(GGU) m(6)t(6)A37 methyltransferase TsaA
MPAGGFVMKPIGIARSPYRDTAEIPTGPGAKHEVEGTLELLPEYEAGLTDIEGFSHLYVIWVFDRAEGFDLMPTPPTDTRPRGVFSTRSPRRPNPIALTVVRLLGREGCRLRVRGLDMLDGTPILDIKPYLTSVPPGELRRGWMDEAAGPGGVRPMSGGFSNVYDDQVRAEAYARLEFPGTYYLAFRDLPALIREHVHGRRALDFGCGTGRSTRFLRGLGFDVLGVDISEPMLERARERDPGHEYRLVPDGDLDALAAGGAAYDLVLSAFTFDNIPTMEKKVALFDGLRRLLAPEGRVVNLVSSPEIYVHEWTSFSTKDHPENRAARSGGKVRIVMLDVQDRRPVEDIVWSDEDYLETYRRAGLVPIRTLRPLGRPEEPFAWVNETTIAPWVIYVLRDARGD